jgi:hypothetical protein
VVRAGHVLTMPNIIYMARKKFGFLNIYFYFENVVIRAVHTTV